MFHIIMICLLFIIKVCLLHVGYGKYSTGEVADNFSGEGCHGAQLQEYYYSCCLFN